MKQPGFWLHLAAVAVIATAFMVHVTARTVISPSVPVAQPQDANAIAPGSRDRNTAWQPTPGDDWPCFQGGPELTGAARKALPPAPELCWTAATGGRIDAGAAIVGDTVYVVSSHLRSVGSDAELLALSLRDGARKWSCPLPLPSVAAPACADGRVFVGDEEGGFFSVDAAEGKILWRAKFGEQVTAPAVPYGEFVLVGSYDDFLHCLRQTDGGEAWKFDTGDDINPACCVSGNTTYTAGCGAVLRGIKISDGKELFSLDLKPGTKDDGKDFVAAAPVFAEGALYVATMRGRVLAVDAASREIRWDTGTRYDNGFKTGLALGGETLVAAGSTGLVVGLRASDGAQQWRIKVGAEIDSCPAIAGQTAYFGADDGFLRAVSLEDGRQVWRYEAGGRISASPAIAGGRLVIGSSDGTVFCFGWQG